MASLTAVGLVLVAAPGAAQTPIVFTFEDQAATYIDTSNPCTYPARYGLLSALSLTVAGLTMDVTRVGANFDIVSNTSCQAGKPASWGARSLDPFVWGTSTPFNLNFSTGIFSFSVQWGDYGTDSDVMTLTAFSDLNGTGANLG